MVTERGERLRREFCPHTKDRRLAGHNRPIKPKRYCDECIEEEINKVVEEVLEEVLEEENAHS